MNRRASLFGCVVASFALLAAALALTGCQSGAFPALVISSVNPPSAMANSASFTLRVTGTGFQVTDVVVWNGTALPTQGVSSTELDAFVSNTLLTSAATVTITVVQKPPSSLRSNTVTFTITPGFTTTTTVTSSLNPSFVGQSVTFTATVTSSQTGTPTGTVTFFDGTATLGTGPLNATTGKATFTTSTLAAGTHTITATYSGDTTFAGSTSAPVAQVVNKFSSSATVTSSAGTTVFGQPVTFTAMVTSSGGTPTGTVTFLAGTATLGTGIVNASGQASFTTSALPPGTSSITAMYGGDSMFASTTSPAVAQTVNKDNTTTTVNSSANPSVFGQAVTFMATVTAVAPGAGTPTGTVNFFDGITMIGTGTLSGGAASFMTSTLTVGSHTITVIYVGDANFNTSTSGALPQVVNKANTNTGLTSSVNPSALNQAVTFTATITIVAPGAGTVTGTVTFSDGSTTIGTGTVSGGKATFTISTLTVGTHTITAAYGGDGNFNASTSAPLTQTVNAKASTTTTVASSANPSTVGQSVTFTATVTTSGSLPPTGTVTFLDGVTSLGTGTLSTVGSMQQATFTTAALTAGTHSITASYGGDTNSNGSTSAPVSQVVNAAKTNTTTTLASSANPSTVGQSVTFTATVTPASGSAVPTGTVTFLDGSATLGTGTLGPTGTATFSTATLTAGTHMITASYGGDANFNGSTSTVLTQTVNASGITVTLQPGVAFILHINGKAAFGVTVTGDSSNAGATLSDGGAGGSFLPSSTSNAGTTIYTAPSSVPSSGMVTITATSKADTSKSASVTLTITALGANTANVTGRMVFLFHGFAPSNSPSPVVDSAGTFVPDGMGGVGGIQVDFIDPTTAAGVTLVGCAGDISVGADNRGLLLLFLCGPGAAQVRLQVFRFALTDTSGTTPARIIRFDDTNGTGIHGSGLFIKQASGVTFSAGTFNTGYAGAVSGMFGAGVGRVAAAFVLQFDGLGNISSTNSELDADASGALATGVSASGSYIVTTDPTNGTRMTITLTTTLLSTSGSNTFHWAAYPVSAGEILVVSTDLLTATSPVVAGRLLRQSSTLSLSSANYAGYATSLKDGGITPDVQLILVTPSGGASGSFTGMVVENRGGTVGMGAISGTYATASNGRTPITTVQGKAPVLYLASATQAVGVGTDGGATTLYFTQQTATAPTLPASFGAGTALPTIFGEDNIVLEATISPVGVISGTADDSSSSSLNPNQTVTGTAGIPSSSGFGAVTLTSPSAVTLEYLVASPTLLFEITITTGDTKPILFIFGHL